MKNQMNEMQYYIRVVREESIWGKKQTLNNYATYIQQEADELMLALKLADRINVLKSLRTYA